MKSPLPAGATKVAGQVLALLVVVLILVLLVRMLEGISFAEVAEAIRALPADRLAAAVALAVFGYAWLIGYDYLALRYLGKSVPLPRLAFASLCAFALQRNIGPAPITGGAVRYHFYRRYGVSPADGALIATLCGLFFGTGIVLAGGLSLLFRPQAMAQAVMLQPALLRLAGAAMLLGLGGFLFWTYARHHPIRIRGWEMPAPSLRLASTQLVFGLIDLAAVAAVVYVLLPATVQVGYPAFLGMYVIAVLVGAISHVPGGLGVFESVLLLLLPAAPAGALLAALLAFRGIYYLLPLLTMGTAAGLYEGVSRLRR